MASPAALLPDDDEDSRAPPTLSRGRHWVLATYALLAAGQGAAWSVPGALQPSLAEINGVSSDTIQLYLNYGCLFFIPCALPVMYALDKYGLRGSIAASLLLVVSGNVLRCFATNASPSSSFFLQASFICNAIAGPVAMAVPSKLAQEWFPAHERTTATAIASVANLSGPLWAYLLVPLVCPDATCSVPQLVSYNACLASFAAINIGMFLAYFPSRPPHAPSASAAISRRGEATVTLGSLGAAVTTMFRSPPYVALLFAYALACGLFNCFSALLTQSLGSVGASQSAAGWVGAGGNAFAVVAGVTMGAVSDTLKARSRLALKLLLVGTMTVGGCAMTAYSVAVQTHGSFSGAVASYCVAQACMGSFVPLAFDLAAELTYPAPEATMLMGLTTSINATSIIFLFMPASSFLLWATPSAAALMLASAVVMGAILPAGAPRFEYDNSKRAGEGGG